MRSKLLLVGFSATLVFVLFFGRLPVTSARANAQEAGSNSDAVKRGEYLVTIGLCHDCHTPKKMTEKGPEPDMTVALSGHPASSKVPEIPPGVLVPNKWMAMTNDHLSAWAGPWGVSFAMNLTPDEDTGLGSWTEDMFFKAIRTGKHLGAPDGRTILPPMPWPMIAQMTDDDLKAIWAYLRSLKPIKNAIPEPIPPQGAAVSK